MQITRRRCDIGIISVLNFNDFIDTIYQRYIDPCLIFFKVLRIMRVYLWIKDLFFTSCCLAREIKILDGIYSNKNMIKFQRKCV